jgi:capsular polysaccharide transport system permease protein
MVRLVKNWMGKQNPLFVLIVLLPTILSIFYYGLFASDVYISEAKFVIRTPEKSSPSGIGLLLKGAGFTNAGDEIHAAQGYLASRDALRELEKGSRFRDAYSRSSISIFNRFDPIGLDGSFEALFEYYGKRVRVDFDPSSSITTLTVRAYDPADAKRLNEHLLHMAETTVNRLNARGRQDLIQFADTEVNAAKSSARNAALALSAFRNARGLVDPEKQATIQLQMISKLQDELIAAKTQLREMLGYAPRSPQISVLRDRIAALESEVRLQSGLVAGGQGSLATSAAQYQRLMLESQFADRQLGAAMASLQEAQNEARRKQAYVERIVQPNQPDEALEPARIRSIFTTFLLSLIVWGVAAMLLAGVREHRN